MSGSFVASVLAGVTLTTALALAASRIARHSRAAFRHVVLAASFAVLWLLPVAALVVPSIRVEVPIVTTGEATSPVVDAIADLISSDPPPSIAAGASAPAVQRNAMPSLAMLLLVIWMAGAVISLVPVLTGLLEIRRLRRTGTPWLDGQVIVDRLAGESHAHGHVSLQLHTEVAGPMTCGLARPTILLPTDADTWAPEDLTRAVVHELEHVRRRDWLSQCVARVLCACYWFHPLVWIARRQLALEAERACDDAVLASADATRYADQLVDLAKRLSSSHHRPILAMANRGDLTTRIRALLDGGQARGRAGAVAIALAGLASIALALAMSPLRLVASAQVEQVGASASAGAPAQSPTRFDAATVKPCETDEPPRPAGGGARSSQGGFPTVSPGRFTIECGTVERLISNAYVLHGQQLENNHARIGDVSWWKGGPEWIRYDKYTIEAVAAGVTDKEVLLGPMLRTLLEERFKLKLHRETIQAPLYNMTIAKGGLKIQPMPPGGCAEYVPGVMPADPRGQAAAVLAGTAPPTCGGMTMMGLPGHSQWVIGGTTMPNFAGTLTTSMDHFVVDKTGVDPETKYNIRLEFAADEHMPGADKRNPRTEFAPADAPLIFAALEQQLGLHLEPTKGPQGVLVIDHIDRPDFAQRSLRSQLRRGEPAASPQRAKGPGR